MTKVLFSQVEIQFTMQSDFSLKMLCFRLHLYQCGMVLVTVPLDFVLVIFVTSGNALNMVCLWKCNAFIIFRLQKFEFETLLFFLFSSDVSEIPEETYPFLQDCEILIMVLSLSLSHMQRYTHIFSCLHVYLSFMYVHKYSLF